MSGVGILVFTAEKAKVTGSGGRRRDKIEAKAKHGD